MRLLLLSLLALSLSGCGTFADPGTWFADDPGQVKPTELKKLENTIGLKKLWSSQIGSGSDGRLLSLVPFVNGERVFAASADGVVAAFHAITGDKLWSIETKLELSGGPGGNDELLLLGTLDGDVLALDQNNGTEKWRATVSSEILSVPVIAYGVVVVHTQDGKLFGLDAETGEIKWQHSRKVPVLTLRGSGSPVISGTNVFCGFAGGRLVALDLSSGNLQWEVTVTIPSGRSELERMVDIDGTPLIVDNVIYVSSYQGDMAAIGEITGTMLWRRELSAYGSIASDWRYLYAVDTNANVFGINIESGAVMWKQDQLLHRQLTPPVAVDGYVVTGDLEGYLHWLSHDDGHLAARIRVGDSAIRIAPVEADGIVYAYTDKGRLVAVSPSVSE